MTVQRLIRLRYVALRRDRGFAVVSAQRHVRDRAGRGDPRLLSDGFEQVIEDSDTFG